VLRLTLTQKGEALTENALTIYTDVIDKAMSASSAEECDMVGDVMRRMLEKLTKSEDQ